MTIYKQLMAISQEAVEKSQYGVAYHALAAALHCAEDLEDEQSLASVEQVAKAQQEWIDAHTPEHLMSTVSVHKRGGTSMYHTLARQAAVRAQILQQKHRQECREQLLWPGDADTKT